MITLYAPDDVIKVDNWRRNIIRLIGDQFVTCIDCICKVFVGLLDTPGWKADYRAQPREIVVVWSQ